MTTHPLLYVAGSHVAKFLSLNVSGTNRDVVPKQKYNRFSSVGDDVHATTTFKYAWASPDILFKEVLRNLRRSIDF